MKTVGLVILAAGLATAGPSFAQSAATGSKGDAPTLAQANKVKQDLQNAGFADVKVVAESFVVQAKTKDGDPVVMTIGPRGMTIFEAAHPAANSSSSAGSAASTTSGSAASTTHK
jgi:hypothetical protein